MDHLLAADILIGDQVEWHGTLRFYQIRFSCYHRNILL
jgi:hypothetical protein